MDTSPESPAPANPEESAGTQMAVFSITISAILFVAKFAGLFKEHLLARYFRLSAVNDVYKVIYNSIIFNLYTKVEKLLRPTYLPEFVKQKEQDERQAWRLTSALVTLHLVVVGGLAVGLVIGAGPLLRTLWPDLARDSLAFQLGIVLLRIMAPALVLYSLSIMPELTLHAYKRFTLPALAEAGYKILLFAVLLIGVELLWPPGSPRAILAAGLGVAIGGVSRLLIMLPGLRAKLRNFRLSLALSRTPGLGSVLFLMLPVVVGLVFSMFRTLADSMVCTRLGEGMYTALTFGRQLSDAGIMILPLAVSFVIYPYVSEWALREDRQRLADSLLGMTRAMAFIFIPLSVGMILLAEPLVRLIFQYGKFQEADVSLVTVALICYASGLFIYAVEGSLNKWYFALKDTLTPNFVGAFWAIVHICIAVFGGLYGGLGLVAVALALPISKGSKVISLYLLLRPRLARVAPARVYPFIAKLIISTTAMAAVVYWLAGVVTPLVAAWSPPLGGHLVRMLVLVSVTGGAGAIVYLAMAALLRIEEVGQVGQWLRQKGGKLWQRLGR